MKPLYKGFAPSSGLAAKNLRRVCLAEWHIEVDVELLSSERVDLRELLAGVYTELAVPIFQIDLNIPFDFRQLLGSFDKGNILYRCVDQGGIHRALGGGRETIVVYDST